MPMLPQSVVSEWKKLESSLPLLPEAERQKLSELIQSIRWTQENEAIRYFVPHGGQQEFFNLITQPGAFIVISGAGNGWGKSEMLAAIFAAIMWPTLAPPALAHPFITDWQYPKRARIYSTPAELEEIGSLQTAIKKLFPQD